MKVLFAVTHVGFLRNFESTLALLAERGHHVHIASDRRQVADVIDVTPIVNRLRARYPSSFTFEAVGFSKRSAWYVFSLIVRAALDYWRYLTPEFDQAPALRARGREHAPAPLVWLSDRPWLRTPTGIRLLRRLFTALERAIPPRREVEQLFNRERWDLLFVTPLLYFGTQQVDYVRAARRRGITSLLGVGSWDHLTTKGLIHERPDRVVVWNEHQRSEGAALHGLDPDHVIVTGAQAYDHWFALQASTTRAAFCGAVGLPADRPYLLYLCSSPFIAPHEVAFVRDWIRAVRASASPALRTVGLMVRPHPQNAKQWSDVDLREFGDAVIWPRAGANPIELSARYEYYDSMYHSHAVVGINTSALIESGIVGRLVYSIKATEFAGTQEGTLHFQHLKNGGLLRMADTLAAHTAQLERSFASVERDREQIRRFIQRFVRPSGLDRPATPQVVDAAEATSRLALTPLPLPFGTAVLQAVLRVVFFPFEVRFRIRRPRIRTDRQYWYSVWRHASRPVRLVGRRLHGLAYAGWRRVRSRQYWYSMWRHAVRPVRLVGRKIRQAAPKIRTDRQYWYSVWRHATRPPRLLGRRIRWVAIRGAAALKKVRTDRRYWHSVWRHATKPLRILVRRVRWVVVHGAAAISRSPRRLSTPPRTRKAEPERSSKAGAPREDSL
jgi:hypothetical protein